MGRRFFETLPRCPQRWERAPTSHQRASAPTPSVLIGKHGQLNRRPKRQFLRGIGLGLLWVSGLAADLSSGPCGLTVGNWRRHRGSSMIRICRPSHIRPAVGGQVRYWATPAVRWPTAGRPPSLDLPTVDRVARTSCNRPSMPSYRSARFSRLLPLGATCRTIVRS